MTTDKLCDEHCEALRLYQLGRVLEDFVYAAFSRWADAYVVDAHAVSITAREA